MSARFRVALAIGVLAVLAYGTVAGVGTGAPAGAEAADCFHIGTDGQIGDCADAPGPAPSEPLRAANWTWWGPAAGPVALAAAAAALWAVAARRLRARSASAARRSA